MEVGGVTVVFNLGKNSAEVDVEATKALYKDRSYVNTKCCCPSCRNYVEKIRCTDKPVARFFSGIGVDPVKAESVWAYLPGDAPFTQRYHCVFPIVCTQYKIKDEESFSVITDGFSVSFREEEGKLFLVADWTLPWISV